MQSNPIIQQPFRDSNNTCCCDICCSSWKLVQRFTFTNTLSAVCASYKWKTKSIASSNSGEAVYFPTGRFSILFDLTVPLALQPFYTPSLSNPQHHFACNRHSLKKKKSNSFKSLKRINIKANLHKICFPSLSLFLDVSEEIGRHLRVCHRQLQNITELRAVCLKGLAKVPSC